MSMDQKLKNIKDIISYIKVIFDRKSYQNVTFFKVVVASIMIIMAIWLFSSVYFASKVYSFVTERVTNLQDRANHEITTKGESLGYLGYTLINYKNDEREAAREVYESAERDIRAAKLKEQEDKLNRIMAWMATVTYEQAISGKYNDAESNLDYLSSCNGSIYNWMPKRNLVVQTKLKVLEKYKKELESRSDWDKGEKRAKEDYIKEYGNIDSNISIPHLLRILKEKQPEELMLTSHTLNGDSDTIESLEGMHLCMNKGEEVLKSLYYYWYSYAEYDDPYWNFQKLKSLANGLQIGQDLDFTVIDIITEEVQRFQAIPGYRNIRPFDYLRRDIQKGWYGEKIHIVMSIFEETNQRLAQIDPNNTGFKTNAYKFRMREYGLWKAKWDEMQAIQHSKKVS